MSELTIRDLHIFYGRAEAVHGISLNVHEGELVTVLGPNGAGKTTLMKAIAGTVTMRGEITLNGQDITQHSPQQRPALGIGHCPEGRRLFSELSVRTNLMLGAYTVRDKNRIARNLERIHTLFPVLQQRSEQQVSTLSGGEQQMVAVGRALMCDPKVLLLDEPSVGIAQGLKNQIFSAVRQICDSGVAVLLVEQDVRSALTITDRVYVLEAGVIVREGTPAELSSNDEIRRSYLGMS